MAEHVGEEGKRVSWVELYLDLVFVLAVGQLAHLIVDKPEMHSVWIALGLFFTLWWTWVGFAVLYNRRGADTLPQRLLFLAGSVPAGVAAVAIEPASTGDITVFAVSLAVIRLLLAAANALSRSPAAGTDPLRMRIARASLVSAALFLVSLAVPAPFRYLLWAIGILTESGAMLTEDRTAVRRARRNHDLTVLQPTDPGEALDPHHFAERFGLFLIILLGEVVVEAGQSSAAGHLDATGTWAALVGAMVMAAALWWLYFDAAVDINLTVLRLSGGSPAMARVIFAIGHMLPAFGLLIAAAGIGLLLEEHPPPIAYSLACVGCGIYLGGTRAFLIGTTRVPRPVRVLMLIATFELARLRPELSPHAYVWVLAGWISLCAALSTNTDRSAEERVVARYAGKV